MTFLPQENIVENGIEKTLFQFRQSPLFIALVSAFLSEVQTTENILFTNVTDRPLQNAVGIQLDRWGEFIDEIRAGRDDDSYRDALIAQLQIRASMATRPGVNQIVARYCNPLLIQQWDLLPAATQFFVWIKDGTTIPQDLKDIIDAALPAGTDFPTITVLGTADIPMAFAASEDPADDATDFFDLQESYSAGWNATDPDQLTVYPDQDGVFNAMGADL